MAVAAWGAYGASVFVKSAAGEYAASVVTKTTPEKDYGASVVALGTQFPIRGVESVGDIGESLPNQFYGIAEVAPVTVNFDNQDGEFSFLLSEEIRGAPVRIRRVNEVDGEVATVFEGALEQVELGLDAGSITAAVMDTSALQTPIPYNRVLSNDGTFGDVLLTADGGKPINIVYGKVQKVPLILVNSNTVTNTYDYLVGEGVLDVREVYRNDLKSYSTVFTYGGVSPVFPAPTFGQPFEITITSTNTSLVDDALVGMYVRLLVAYESSTAPRTATPDAEGMTARITAVRHPLGVNGKPDLTTKILALDTDLSKYVPSTHDVAWLRLQEWGTYRINNRTYVQFGVQQVVDGTNASLTADVARFTTPSKNMLFDTDFLVNEWWFEGVGSTQPSGAWQFNTSAVISHPTNQSSAFIAPNQVDQCLRWNLISARPLEQAVPFPVVDGLPFTFSLWFKDGAYSTVGRILKISLTSDGAGATVTSTTYTLILDELWHRLSVTKSSGWGTGATKITVRIETGDTNGFNAQLYGTQLEPGVSPTWYEAVGSKLYGAYLRRPVQVIRDLITAPYGLNQDVDPQSFEAAETATFVDSADPTKWFFLMAQGVLPFLSGETPTIKDVLDELAMFRGFKLRKKGGAWTIVVDDRRSTSVLALGSEETPHRNLLSIEPIRRTPLADVVKTVRVLYGQEVFFDAAGQSQILFPYALEKDVNTFGSVREYPMHMIRDSNTADRVMQYLAGWIPILDRKASVETDWSARDVAVGNLVTLAVPRLQPENLITNSENIGGGTWGASGGVSAPTIVLNAAQDPFGRSFRASSLVATAGNSGVAIDSGVAAASKHVIGYVWARTDGAGQIDVTNRFAIGIFNSQTSTASGNTASFPVGPTWRRYRMDMTYASGSTGNVFLWIYFPTNVGQKIFVWGAQLCIDYDAPYIQTVNANFPAERTYVVSGVRRSTPVTTQLELLPYTDAPFNYTKSVFPSRVTPSQIVDPRMVPPSAPTSLVLASSGRNSITVSGNAYVEAYGIVQFVMPSNATEVVVQIMPSNGIGFTDVATVSAHEVPVGSVASVRIGNLIATASYSVRAIALNSYGLFSQSATIAVSV